MSKNLIVKDNALINASYNLELIEQRLILLAIGQSRKIGQDFNAHSRLKISVSDYVNIGLIDKIHAKKQIPLPNRHFSCYFDRRVICFNFT